MPRATRREKFDDLLDALATGESLGALAARAGVASRTLWRWRTGQSPRPQLGALALVAAALRCDVARVRAAVTAGLSGAQR